MYSKLKCVNVDRFWCTAVIDGIFPTFADALITRNNSRNNFFQEAATTETVTIVGGMDPGVDHVVAPAEEVGAVGATQACLTDTIKEVGDVPIFQTAVVVDTMETTVAAAEV